MTRKRKRLIAVLTMLSCMGAGVALILNTLEENLVFFFTPKELTDTLRASEKPIRIGGLVKEDSIQEYGDASIRFAITDYSAEVIVQYRGLVPSLFREGQGVVAEGSFTQDGLFSARTILAKHDEKYMPPKVKEALQESGQWRDVPSGPKGMEDAPALP